MVQSTLCLYKGARTVEREELDRIPAPPPTPTWFPLRHGHVLDCVQQTLTSSGYQVTTTRLGLSRDDHQFFGVLDLAHRLADGVTLAVGVRNSTNKTFPLGFCAGCKVFVCDNLAFRSELLVTRKHTRFGRERFAAAIGEAVVQLQQFQVTEAVRIERYQATPIPDVDAESIILKSFEQGIVPVRWLSTVIAEWRSPSFDDFRPRTLWSLENAFTTALRDMEGQNPPRYAGLTMRLQGLLAEATWLPPTPAAIQVS